MPSDSHVIKCRWVTQPDNLGWSQLGEPPSRLASSKRLVAIMIYNRPQFAVPISPLTTLLVNVNRDLCTLTNHMLPNSLQSSLWTSFWRCFLFGTYEWFTISVLFSNTKDLWILWLSHWSSLHFITDKPFTLSPGHRENQEKGFGKLLISLFLRCYLEMPKSWVMPKAQLPPQNIKCTYSWSDHPLKRVVG